MSATADPGRVSQPPVVRHFREILLWPLQLLRLDDRGRIQRHWEQLKPAGGCPWREVVDEFSGDPGLFQERHYNEFVTFLPYVQRFLYGEGRAAREGEADGRVNGKSDDGASDSPMRTFRRMDVTAVRVVPHEGAAPIELQIAHIDLIFFFDIDVVLLNVEVHADDLPLDQAQEVLYRFGRAYPAGWEANGQGLHCMQEVQWLAADGHVLAASDAGERERFLCHVGEHRAPRISAHWAWLIQPLVFEHGGPALQPVATPIRVRQIEYYRMPVMALLAVDEPRRLTRSDFVRLGLVTPAPPASDAALPYSERHLADFEARHCYDRFWSYEEGPKTRYLASGRSLVVVGEAGSTYFMDAERGVLGQFRHQQFLLFLIAHFQRAALLMFSERLVIALSRLQVDEPESTKRFKRVIRQQFENFLRFTHRYWFHEISDQAHTRALFRMTADHLALDGVYREVKERIHDMAEYLDSDTSRREATTVVRLTVVTTFGLIGTVASGLLGMNLLAWAEEPLVLRIVIFVAVMAVVSMMTLYTIVRSKRLSDLLDVLSNERLTATEKWRAAQLIWRARTD